MRNPIPRYESSTKAMKRGPGAALLAVVMAASAGWTASPAPRDWIDPATGHRVIRLDDDGASSFYFHQNGFTAQGDKLVLATRGGLAVFDWKTRKLQPLVEGRAGQAVVGKKARQVFYIQDGAIRATHLDTGKTRAIAELPPEIRGGSGLALNADETLLGGSFVARAQGAAVRPASLRRGRGLEARWAARLPMRLYTVSIADGKIKTFQDSTDWLNHVQFSPTDPGLMLFCHEGPWHKVDRIWTIRTDGSGLRKIHSRTLDMEIAGHEFFSPDGKIVWYDLQTPRGKEFWLAGHVLESGKTIKYRIEREHWSVHYNVSPDGSRFVGDGGGPHSVAAPGNGQWIYLFTPRDGKLEVEKLVDLSQHHYQSEPNVAFTPDGQWVVFRSNMHGATHVYAVEVKKSKNASK